MIAKDPYSYSMNCLRQEKVFAISGRQGLSRGFRLSAIMLYVRKIFVIISAGQIVSANRHTQPHGQGNSSGTA
jgi:hypothetical protein